MADESEKGKFVDLITNVSDGKVEHTIKAHVGQGGNSFQDYTNDTLDVIVKKQYHLDTKKDEFIYGRTEIVIGDIKTNKGNIVSFEGDAPNSIKIDGKEFTGDVAHKLQSEIAIALKNAKRNDNQLTLQEAHEIETIVTNGIGKIKAESGRSGGS